MHDPIKLTFISPQQKFGEDNILLTIKVAQSLVLQVIKQEKFLGSMPQWKQTKWDNVKNYVLNGAKKTTAWAEWWNSVDNDDLGQVPIDPAQ